MSSFKELLVWQQAMWLAKECYFLTKSFPREEIYGMTSQIRRAAASIPANIAEGSARGSQKDFAQFLRIAQGSLRELETHLLLSIDIGMVTSEYAEPILQHIESVSILLMRLIQSTQK